MNGVKNTAAVLSLLWMISGAAYGQLPDRDARFVTKLKQELSLSAVQASQVDSLFAFYHEQLQQVEAYIDSVESSNATEAEVTMRVAIKAQERKDLKAERESDLTALFTDEQQVIYTEKIKPAKPQVLHFGIHNRADCKVCDR